MSTLTSGDIVVAKFSEKKKKKKVDNHIYEACESNCQECGAKGKVNNDKNSVVEHSDLFIKKDMENKKKMREKEIMKMGSPHMRALIRPLKST